MKILPVIRPTEIYKWYLIIREGLTQVQTKSLGEETHDSFLYSLVLKNLFLYIILDTNTNTYIGFFTARRIQDYYKDNLVNILIIKHHYQKENTIDKGTNLFIQDYIDKLARQTECSFIKIYTIRKADRYLKQLGYTKTYTEYVRGVSNENL